MKPDRIIRILNFQYNQYGSSKYTINEPVSIRAHSIQSALWIMDNVKYHYPDLIVSSLLHDYGHISKGIPICPSTNVDDKHEVIGADALSLLGFKKEVTEPIRLHVLAKRYLCTINPYYSLSEGSKKSLFLQGGILTEKEINAFEKNPFFNEALLIRHSDDASKEPIEHSDSILKFEKIIRYVLER